MKRLIEKIVFSGFITAWRFATVPTRRSPESVKATTDGVVRPPSAFSSTVGSSPSITAMAELVVPRSIPIVFATFDSSKAWIWLFQSSRPRNLSGSLADIRSMSSKEEAGHWARPLDCERLASLLLDQQPAPETEVVGGVQAVGIGGREATLLELDLLAVGHDVIDP